MEKHIAPEGSVHLINDSHGLSYSPEFKDWVKKNPGAMSRVVKLIENIVNKDSENKKYENITDGTITIAHSKEEHSDIFEVTVGKDKFFVKRDEKRLKNTPRIFHVGGQKEYIDSLIAKIDLGDDPDIEIINFQLGYSNMSKEKPISYFVSKWRDLKTVDECLNNTTIPKEERKELLRKLSRIKILFQAYQDISTRNMFYNENSKKVVMFDLNMNPNFHG